MCQAPSAPTRALGERRGEMNRPPPQLANSKQIKLSRVPARLFHGGTLGDWGHLGRASRDLGLPTQRRKRSGLQGPGVLLAEWDSPGGMGGAVITMFLTCTSPLRSLGSVTVWSGHCMGPHRQLPQGLVGIACEPHLTAPQASSSAPRRPGCRPRPGGK